MNATFITLIPKTDKSRKVPDYHAKSLVRSVYKIIIKILSLKLSERMIQFPLTNTFLRGRQMLDASLVVKKLWIL